MLNFVMTEQLTCICFLKITSMYVVKLAGDEDSDTEDEINEEAATSAKSHSVHEAAATA